MVKYRKKERKKEWEGERGGDTREGAQSVKKNSMVEQTYSMKIYSNAAVI